jgi:hypothetical protein
VPARFVTLGHHDVDTILHVPLRVHGLAGERGDLHAVRVGLVDHILGR